MKCAFSVNFEKRNQKIIPDRVLKVAQEFASLALSFLLIFPISLFCALFHLCAL